MNSLNDESISNYSLNDRNLNYDLISPHANLNQQDSAYSEILNLENSDLK